MESLDFRSIFGSPDHNHYDAKTIESITRHRRALEGTLMFDRLLNVVGMHNAKEHYPPHNTAALKSLCKSILNTSFNNTYKAALLYYLRKDIGLSPKNFASETYLPERYITLIDGLWLLDRLKFADALVFLTDPSLIPTFAEEILCTLAKHAPHDQQAELVLQYYNVTSPALGTTRGVHAYFGALASKSVTEAFFFTRRQPEDTQKVLFELLVSRVLGSTTGEERARQSLELVGLPFNHVEEDWFEEYLLKGKGKTLHGARDTVIVRRLSIGRMDEAAALAKDSHHDRRIDGINWHDLAKGLA